MSGSVLIVTPRWRRDGGVATHVMASATALAADGADVHVVSEIVEPGTEVPGVTLHPSPHLHDRTLTAERRLGDALAGPLDVVHFHQIEDPELAASLRRRAPVIVSMHGYSACTSELHYFKPGQECTRAHGPGCVPNLLLRGCAHTRNPLVFPRKYKGAGGSARLLRESDLAISYSSVIDAHLSANGVSRRAIVPLFSTLVPRRAEGHEQRRRVVFAGRVVHAKGLHVLVRAARAVEAEFLVYGEGWALDPARSLARRIGVQERFSFRGWLAPDELARELAEASVVAMPSVWPEPFGLVGIEAFSCGRPVVASATGGVRDWLEDGVSGLAVPAGDERALAAALAQLLADPERQRRMGAAGAKMVAERFTAERHVAALREAYASARAGWERRRPGAPATAHAEL
jgi:glycosyltransferase involved in cell wall biosynthesis